MSFWAIRLNENHPFINNLQKSKVEVIKYLSFCFIINIKYLLLLAAVLITFNIFYTTYLFVNLILYV